MVRPWCLVLAALCLLAAFLLPVREIDARRAAHSNRLQTEANAEAALLEPGDDSYVDYINEPYPVSSGWLYRWLLLGDAVLLGGLAWFPLSIFSDSRGPGLGSRLRSELPAITSLFLLAAAFRFTGAGRDLWIDEITTLVRHARGPAIEVFLQATSSNNHLLNSLLAHFSLRVFGEHAWALRLPAILLGSATIPVLYLLVRRFGPPWEALLAAGALALSYHHIFFSQDARGYAGQIFGALLATWALLEALETDAREAWLAYLAGMWICVVSVMLGCVIMAAQLIVVLFRGPRRSFLFAFATALWLILHAYAFVIPDLLGFVMGEYGRPEVGWRLSSELLDVVSRGLRLGGAILPALGAGGLLLTLGFVSLHRQDRAFPALLLLPELLMLGTVWLLRAGAFPRFFLFALPVVCIFAARGVRVIVEALPAGGRRLGRTACFAGLLLVSLIPLRTWWRYPKQDYLGARAYLESVLKPGDALVSMGVVGEGYRYYWPEVTVVNRASALRRIMASHQRVWLLYGFPRDMLLRRPTLQALIQVDFSEQRTFPGMVGDGEVRVCLFERAPVSSRVGPGGSEGIP